MIRKIKTKYIFIALLLLGIATVSLAAEQPPELSASSYWGYVYENDIPMPNALIKVFDSSKNEIANTTSSKEGLYQITLSWDNPNTQQDEGVVAGEIITFSVNGTIVTTKVIDAVGTNTNFNIRKVVKSITDIINNGVVNTTVNIKTPDNNITVTIPNGTIAKNKDDTPLTNISSSSFENVTSELQNSANSSSLKFLGKIISLKPEGAKFTPYILVRFNYSDSDISQGGEGSIKAYWYNNNTGKWDALVIHEHNQSANYLIAQVPHFSTFALLGSSTTTPTNNNGGGSGGGTSSSGGGGGGGASGENQTNIVLKEKYDKHIYLDTLTSYAFTDIKNPVMFVNITGNTNAGEINTAVEVLKTTSTLVSSPPSGIVYMNLNIWVGTSGFAIPKNIKEGIIRFKVSNSWLTTNELTGSNVKMVKWDENKWVELETSEILKDATDTLFEAKTNTFSPFAIIGVKKETVTAQAPEVTETISPIKTPDTTKTTTQAPKTPALPIWAVIGVIIIVFQIFNRIRR